MFKKKENIYALFQFISFIAIISLLTSLVIIGYVIFLSHSSGSTVSFSIDKWTKGIGDVLSFSETTGLVFAGAVFLYSTFGLFIFSWLIGTRIFYLKKKSLFDSLFLVFMMIPVISNIFALIAQFVEKEFFFTETKIDKEAIIQEQTRLIKLEITKEKARINRTKERQQKIKTKKKTQPKKISTKKK